MNIFIIEDEEEIQEIYGEWLSGKGHNVFFCSDGNNLAGDLTDGRNRFGQVDLIITDLNVPNRDGFELVDLFRTSDLFPNSTIPIIVISGFLNEYVKEELIQYGNVFCLEKPTSREIVLDTIAKFFTS